MGKGDEAQAAIEIKKHLQKALDAYMSQKHESVGDMYKIKLKDTSALASAVVTFAGETLAAVYYQTIEGMLAMPGANSASKELLKESDTMFTMSIIGSLQSGIMESLKELREPSTEH